MISAGRKRIGGYAHWFNGDGPDIEKDTVTCCHCNSVVMIDPLRPVEDFTGWCLNCMKFICHACERLGRCLPFEQMIDAEERADRRRIL